jgi:rhodanese-related sulfurtransferase
MSGTEHPIRKALREARMILIVAPLIALAYNLFASTGVPWIREVRKGDTVSYDDLVGSKTTSATDTALTQVQTGITSATVDTTQSATIDTASTSTVAQKQDPKELQRIQDSIKKALAAAQQAHDTAGASMKNVPVKPDRPVAQEAIGKEIGTATALRIFNDKKALFIDARPAAQFSEGHIPGAINVYAEEFRDHIPQLLNYPMDTLVVAYCGGGLCELSHDLADQLRTLGFKKVVVYTGGTTEWTTNNYPFTK